MMGTAGETAGADLVLIVEDNPKNRKLARDLLAVHGYRTLEAEDGWTALEAALDHELDLILMDIQLPGMDGYELTRRLKADPRTRQIPVVAVTSYAMKGEEWRAREAGCAAYLSKPIDIRRVMATIAAVLETRRAS